jgi:hypothetical protein
LLDDWIYNETLLTVLKSFPIWRQGEARRERGRGGAAGRRGFYECRDSFRRFRLEERWGLEIAGNGGIKDSKDRGPEKDGLIMEIIWKMKSI